MVWTKRFYEVGSFELKVPKNVLEKNDIIKHGNNYGIVMEIQDDYPDGVTVYGYDLKGITEFRYIETAKVYTAKTPEHIIKNLAQIYLATGNRAITGLTVQTNLNRGIALDFTAEKNMADSLTSLCKQADVGYDISFNESNLIFDVMMPRQNTDVVFTRRLKNIEQMTYTASNYNTYNVVYSKNESDVIVSSGTATGVLRREGYTDKQDEMTTFLADKSEIETLTGNANSKLQYGIDYKLGDYVRIEFGNLTTTKIISEVKFVYEPSNVKVYPTFGTEKENPIKKILKG